MKQDRTWASDLYLVLLLPACLTHCSHWPDPKSPRNNSQFLQDPTIPATFLQHPPYDRTVSQGRQYQWVPGLVPCASLPGCPILRLHLRNVLKNTQLSVFKWVVNMSSPGGSAREGDERHVKVPGFWRSINLPIRPEITWPDLTLPNCLCPKRKEEWEDGRTESVSRWKRN